MLSRKAFLVGLAHRVKGACPKLALLLFGELPFLQEEQTSLSLKHRPRDFVPIKEAFPVGEFIFELFDPCQDTLAAELVFSALQFLFSFLYLDFQIRNMYFYLLLLAVDCGFGLGQGPLALASVGQELLLEVGYDFLMVPAAAQGLVGSALGGWKRRMKPSRASCALAPG